MDDWTNLGDAELEQHSVDVLVELGRRRRIADVPAQVADLARQWAEDGGDPATLAAAIDTA